MTYRRYSYIFSRVLPIASLLLLVLFKFENCAPAPQMAAFASPETDGEVRIVDRWVEQKVAFLNSSVSLPSQQETLSLQGLCLGSPNGQLIEYQVVAMRAVPLMVGSGLIECVMGGFELALNDIHFSSCDEEIQVRAARQGDDANYAETLLRPDCGQ